MESMPGLLANALLRRVYHRVSAVVSLDSEGKPGTVQLFDTDYAGEYMRIDRHAHKVILLSCHPEGMMEPYEEDRIHAAVLRAAAPHALVELYLVNEDEGCIRAKLE